LRQADPGFADDVGGRRVFRIEPGVLITLDYESVARAPDDPMRNHGRQHLAPVADDIAHPIRRVPAEKGHVARPQRALHAHA
jgi:hypothetical protein